MITFVDFCTSVLGLEISAAWRVVLAVAVDGENPANMTGASADLARLLFGDLEEIPDVARRTLIFRCGRGSGKSTFSAALGVYSMFTSPCEGVGRGMIPAVVCVSPSLAASKRLTRVARELVRESRLEKFVAKGADSTEGFEVVRPDGRRVAFMSVAASRGGHTLRGFPILTFIVDESEFLSSSSEVGSGDTHISDRDLLAAVGPRLLGSTVLISTPWGSPNMTAQLFTENFGAPATALAALGPSLLMRPDDHALAERIAIETKRSPEDVRREFFCEAVEGGGSKFFDFAAIERSISKMPPERTTGGRCTAAIDLGFTKDASALVILEHRPSGTVTCVHVDTVKPAKGSPIIPSVLFQRFAPVIHQHGCTAVASDSFNAASVRELLNSHNLELQVYTESAATKASRYIALRDAIARDQVILPNDRRLLDGLRSIVGKPMSGGTLSITAPRRGGQHADACSALVLAYFAMSRGASARTCDDDAVRFAAIVRGCTPDDGSRRNRGVIGPW